MKGMSSHNGKQGLSTIAVHGGVDRAGVEGPVSGTLSQSVNYTQEIGTSEGLRYGRFGNSPNAESVQKRLALLEGAEAALFLSSGMGATSAARGFMAGHMLC
jgi:methionine-gamma-lyase